MATRSYQTAVDEVRAWLAQGRLAPYADVVVGEGYDDLAAIRRCNQGELLELLALFRPGNDRVRARRHIDALRGLVRGPASPSSDDADSDASPRATDSTASEALASPDECRVRIRCTYLYQEDWVSRHLVLHDDKLYCYPDHADQMPEFSVDVASARTVLRQQSATVVSVADRGQHHILVDFGRDEALAAWLPRLQRIQARNRAARDDVPAPDFEDLLQRGRVFKKIKNATASRRRIWCTPDWDKVVWGRPDVQHDVCGLIRVASIQHVDADKLRLNVATATRTLTLEAAEEAVSAVWAAALRWAHDRRIERQVQRDVRLQNPDERQKLRRRRERCEDLLTAGDVFRKLKHGAAVQRKVACTADMALLQWRDETRGRIKGQVAMADVAWVDKDAETRFRIVAKQRVVELEAVDARTRDLWVEVLRFWIYVNSERYDRDDNAG